MHWLRRAPLVAASALACVALAGCASAQSTPAPTTATTAAPIATVPPAEPTPTLVAATATPAPTPKTTIGPTGTLDPSLSDAGVVGRLVIANDTRNDFSGTHDIVGLAADSSGCSFSLEGDEFTAVAWYDAAPDGMLHQMSVSVPADETPANDGEQRAGIDDGSVFADFATHSGFGSAYGGATSKGDGSSSSIDIVVNGDTMIFSFTGQTWDGIDFSGQMMCAGVGAIQ